jgi:hypothetical protein
MRGLAIRIRIECGSSGERPKRVSYWCLYQGHKSVSPLLPRYGYFIFE